MPKADDPSRIVRLCVLNALKSSTGSDGTEANDVKEFRNDPADPLKFIRSGAILISTWYPDPSQPTDPEKDDVWNRIMNCMDKIGATTQEPWDRNSRVRQLQRIAEKAK